MSITLRFASEVLDAEGLHGLGQEACDRLRRESGAEVHLAGVEQAPGAKGDPVTVGAIVLSFISSGAAVALFGVLKSYFERDTSLSVEFDGGAGRTIRLDASNMSREQFDRALAIVESAAVEKDGG